MSSIFLFNLTSSHNPILSFILNLILDLIFSQNILLLLLTGTVVLETNTGTTTIERIIWLSVVRWIQEGLRKMRESSVFGDGCRLVAIFPSFNGVVSPYVFSLFLLAIFVRIRGSYLTSQFFFLLLRFSVSKFYRSLDDRS